MRRTPTTDRVETGFSWRSPENPAWDAFATAHAKSPLQRPGWLETLTGAYGLRAKIATLVDADGDLVAGLPMIRGKLPWQDRWTALPFTDALEPVAVDEAARDELLTALSARADAGPTLVRSHVALPGWFSRQVGTMQVLDISGGIDGVLSRADPHHRRSVKRARRAGTGLSAEPIESRAEFLGPSLALTAQSRSRLGAPTQPFRYWSRMWNMHERGEALTVGVHLGERLVASGVFLLGRTHAVYKYGASDRSTRHLRTNFLMFATAFDLLAARGVRSVDLGLSDLRNVGLRKFKARWGGEEHPVRFSATRPKMLPDTLEPGSLLARAIQRTPVFVGRAIGSVAYPFVA